MKYSSRTLWSRILLIVRGEVWPNLEVLLYLHELLQYCSVCRILLTQPLVQTIHPSSWQEHPNMSSSSPLNPTQSWVLHASSTAPQARPAEPSQPGGGAAGDAGGHVVTFSVRWGKCEEWEWEWLTCYKHCSCLPSNPPSGLMRNMFSFLFSIILIKAKLNNLT